ncbi:MAG: ABC transporter permease [Verrucomicrobiales bacterium]
MMRWKSLRQIVEPFIGLIVVLALFALSDDVRERLFTGGTGKLLLVQTVVVALGAMGMTMIIISGGIDLSAGSVVALSSVIGAKCILLGMPFAVVVLLCVLMGGLCGMINGALIAGLRIVPFIVTLGMMGIARGVAKGLANNQTVNYAAEHPDHPVGMLLARTDLRYLFPLPPGVWITAVLALVMIFIMRKTVFGRHVFAIGSNEATARLCGIRVQWKKMMIYAIAGLFFGMAGLMQLSRLSLGDPTTAVGLELEIIAAVVIGGASLSGGTGSILGAMIGALIIAVLKLGSTLKGWENHIQEIIVGVVIIFAVCIDRLRYSGLLKRDRS